MEKTRNDAAPGEGVDRWTDTHTRKGLPWGRLPAEKKKKQQNKRISSANSLSLLFSLSIFAFSKSE